MVSNKRITRKEKVKVADLYVSPMSKMIRQRFAVHYVLPVLTERKFQISLMVEL